MNNFIRRLRKKALLKELKVWTDLMKSYDAEITSIDNVIDEKGKNELTKMQEARLKQLKNSYLEAYNNAKMEAERITKQMKALDLA